MGDDPSRRRGWGDAALRWAVAGLAFAMLGLGVARTIIYVIYAVQILPFPLESHQLEAKMVLMAYRAGAGLSLYPEWRDGPYVANFFAPLDFLLVGGIGRLAGADLRGLFLIGRGVSFSAALLEAAVLGGWAWRRYGRAAGIVAATLSFGIRPLDGFSVTTRPDTPAELLGVLGFLLAVSPARGRRAAGVGLLVLAAFTKQTAAVYLAAAAAALAAEGRRREALHVLGAGIGTIVGIVVAVSLLVEPNFARSLLGEAATPRDVAAWLDLLRRMAVGSPDVLLLPAIGLVLWTRGPDRSPRLAALTVVTAAVALITALKRGSDVNYFLPLRGPEAMAAAALWAFARGPGRRSTAAAVALAVAVASVLSGGMVMGIGQAMTQGAVEFLQEPPGRRTLAAYREAAALAAEPGARMLTDSAFIDLHARERALFGDPWLFRMLVETGRIDPRRLAERVESGYYSVVVTTADLRDPAYDTNAYALPPRLLGPLRRDYELARAEAKFLLYRKKAPGRRGPSGAGP